MHDVAAMIAISILIIYTAYGLWILGCVLMCGVCEHVMGGWKPKLFGHEIPEEGRLAMGAAYGAFALGAMGFYDWWVIPLSLAHWVNKGMFGCGYVYGHALSGVKPEVWDDGSIDGHASDGPEDWQKILGLGNSPWLSLIVLGLLRMVLVFVAFWLCWYVAVFIGVSRPSLWVLLMLPFSAIATLTSIAVGRLMLPEEIKRDPKLMFRRPYWTAGGRELIHGWVLGGCCALAQLVRSLLN
jgi:hypothetical protein